MFMISKTLLRRQKYISTVEFTNFRTSSRKTNNKMEIDWLPSANLITQIKKKVIIHYDVSYVLELKEKKLWWDNNIWIVSLDQYYKDLHKFMISSPTIGK